MSTKAGSIASEVFPVVDAAGEFPRTGAYLVRFVPRTGEPHFAFILWNGEPVEGSPFMFDVEDAKGKVLKKF